jgi:hypothetical protein
MPPKLKKISLTIRKRIVRDIEEMEEVYLPRFLHFPYFPKKKYGGFTKTKGYLCQCWLECPTWWRD